MGDGKHIRGFNKIIFAGIGQVSIFLAIADCLIPVKPFPVGGFICFILGEQVRGYKLFIFSEFIVKISMALTPENIPGPEDQSSLFSRLQVQCTGLFF